MEKAKGRRGSDVPRNVCLSSKRRFEDEDQAKRAAREGMLRDAPPLSTYFCMICHGYHLTSKPRRA